MNTVSTFLKFCGATSFLLSLLITTGCDLTVRTSDTNSSGLQPNGNSLAVEYSLDGRYAVFFSSASNIDAGDVNGETDVFWVDHLAGSRKLISRNASGDSATGASRFPDITPDGRYVVFESEADDLVPDDKNKARDVFVVDTFNGAIDRVSIASNGEEGEFGSSTGSISDDGRYVAFHSDAQFEDDANTSSDIYLRDRILGTTRLMSTDSTNTTAVGDSFDAELSGDGGIVVWVADTDNAIPGDSNGHPDIIWRTTGLSIKVLISSPNSGAQANGGSASPDISNDGSYVVFNSSATNLVTGDTNGESDVFRWYINDAPTNPLIRISQDGVGSEPNGFSFWPSINADGSKVVYSSMADNLLPAGALPLDVNGLIDVYLWEEGINSMGSRTVLLDSTNGQSVRGAISPDGSVLGYDTSATNIGFQDSNAALDVVSRGSFVPKIADVTGGPLMAGQTVELILTGSFAANTNILVGGGGIVNTVITSLSDTSLTVEITAAANATPSNRDLLVTALTPQLGAAAPYGASALETVALVN